MTGFDQSEIEPGELETSGLEEEESHMRAVRQAFRSHLGE